ncbi:MAG: holo-ACP synthase [Cyanobacteria bacterium RU_5_0]|nr:holo-ACP synthase [Cyanobacteria bacterium RU_5_0]
MDVLLGTDIVYVPRIKAAVDRFGERFLQRVFTPTERRDCCQSDSSKRKLRISQLAGRWAAKEAIAKALGTGWSGISYTDIEIQRQANGAPKVCLYRAAATYAAMWGEGQWRISLSHDGDYAIAVAVLFSSS